MSIHFLKDFLLQLAFIATLIYTYQIFLAESSARKRYDKIILTVLFGLSVIMCMSFSAAFAPDYRVDIRIVPLLLGTLYGGWGTGLVLTALIVLYRIYIGVDSGFLTTTLSLVFSMPVILVFQRFYIRAQRYKKLVIALTLLAYYSLIGITSVSLVRGLPFLETVQIHIVHIVINVAALTFFTMLNEKIREMIRKNQQLQSEAKDAEIAFLRSQINPHFLFNALNSIAALCHEEPRKAEELTLDLSRYLQSSFDFHQMETLTTLETELELVKAYLNIEKARFGDRLNVEYEVEADPWTRIPPLILQPLVENAVRHGLMPKIQGGTVKIGITKKSNSVVRFTVEDNGCGISEIKRNELLKPGQRKDGIGLFNIHRRIQLLYGTSLFIESAEESGTKIFFDLPLKAV